MTWKSAEPSDGAGRSRLIIGNRLKVGCRAPGNHVAGLLNPTYNSHPGASAS